MNDTIRALEDKAQSLGYERTVKVSASNTTTVTLKNVTSGNVFEGSDDGRGISPVNSYTRALDRATGRMVAYETRHGG